MTRRHGGIMIRDDQGLDMKMGFAGLGMELPTATLLKSNYDQAVCWGRQDKDWSAIGEVPYKKAGL